MKAVLRKIGSLFIAMLVMLSTMSFSVLQHFCGTELVEQTVFSAVKPCCVESDPAQDQEDGCCNEEQHTVQGQDELTRDSVDLDLKQQAFLTAFVYSYTNLFEGLADQIVPFRHYSPPPLITNIQLIDQVFLI